jgi:hypothetical protein
MTPDNTEIGRIQRRIKDATTKLHELAPHVGSARQVREFSSDQRKNALAAEQIKYIQRGESVAAAENLARSNPVYLEKFKKLEEDYKQAETVIAEWQATMATFEAARSLLAMSRETMRTLEG